MRFLDKIFTSKKKETLSPLEAFFRQLDQDVLYQKETTKFFLLANEAVIGGVDDLDHIDGARRKFHEELVLSKQGKSWFQVAFLDYMRGLKTMRTVEHELPKMDAYLSLYWFYCSQYPNASLPLQDTFAKEIDPRIRRLYDTKCNLDVFTGTILDEARELNDAWKQHFYKASFAFRDGNGDIEVSLKEWRTFLLDFHDILKSRPRVIYDFAKEIVEYQKLFFFFSYVVKVERLNHKKNVFENGSIDKLMRKVINAVYAVDEEHGIMLKRLYV